MNKYAVASRSPRPVPKTHRQDLLRSFVRDSPPKSQSELMQRLKTSGVRVTQSTLSRDLRDLGFVKSAAGYREEDDANGGATRPGRMEGMNRMMRSYLTDVSRAGNLVILKSSPGLAHALGVAMDKAAIPEVIGTVAGDDTLFAAAPDPRRARVLELRFRGLLGRR